MDPCLQRAAAAHFSASTDYLDSLPQAFTEFALHWAGCPDASATVSRLATTDGGDGSLFEHLDALLGVHPYNRVGVARADAVAPYRTLWVILLVERLFSLQPFPTRGEPGEVLPLTFRVDREFDNVAVAVTQPRGDVEFINVGFSDGWAVTGIPLATESGRVWVELLGYGPRGPHVLALFPVAIGRQPSRTWLGGPRPDESWITTEHEAESFAADLVTEDRHRFGLSELERDPRLDRIARAHSSDMASSGFFAHVSPTSGSVVDRLIADGYAASFAAENIAMGTSLGEAQEGLMRSPGHRAAILSPDATHFGVGVVFSRRQEMGEVYVLTQVFAKRTDIERYN
jgi:uncharacterized protein YkwD